MGPGTEQPEQALWHGPGRTTPSGSLSGPAGPGPGLPVGRGRGLAPGHWQLEGHCDACLQVRVTGRLGPTATPGACQ
eukprot:2943227-Rhodomonas_salina.2